MLLKFIFLVCTVTSVYNVNANTDEVDEIEDYVHSEEIVPVNSEIEDVQGTVQETVSEVNDSINNILLDVKNTISEAEKKIEKWKAWRKHLDCSNKSENLVRCRLINLSAKGNPDAWKRETSNAEIPVKAPEGFEIKKIPTKIDGGLSEWLSKVQGIVGNADVAL